MAPIPPRAFRAALAALDEREFASFVADLYRAGGSQARIEVDDDRDRLTVVVADGGGERRLRLSHPGPVARRVRIGGAVRADTDAEGVDGVVTSVRSDRPGVVDAAALRERALYGVDAATRERLFDRLGCPAFVADAGPGSAAGGERFPGIGSLPIRGALTVLAVLVVAAGLALTTGTGGAPEDRTVEFAPVEFPGAGAGDATGGAGGDGGREIVTITPAPTPAEAERSSGPASALAANASYSYPPGLSPEGIVDADALADAHASAVTGRSYRLTLTYREFESGLATALRRETVRVATPERYVVSLQRIGDPEGAARIVSDPPDGERGSRFAQFGSDVRGDGDALRNGEGRFADRVERYLGWYLSVERSRVTETFVENGTRYYWVVLSGDSWPGVENTTGSALIDERGIVHEVRRSYDLPDEPGVSATVSIRYTFAPVEVPAPGWLDEPGSWNGTTGGGPATGGGSDGLPTVQG